MTALKLMKSRMVSCRLLALVCLAVLAEVVPAAYAQNIQPAQSSAEMLGYGSRAGMDVTVVSKQGIGTANAFIVGRLTEENGRNYCQQYALDPSQKCIDTYLKETKIANSIGANCETGVFTTFYGEKFRYLGKQTPSDDLPEYRVINLRDSTLLDGSSASGLFYNMEQFKALCPNLTPPKAQSAASLQAGLFASSEKRAPNAVLKGWGYVPFAIVCADYDTADMMFRLFNNYIEETMQDKWTGGASSLIHGKPIMPDEKIFGCTTFEPGTKAVLEQKTPVPVVSVIAPDGKTVHGVTTLPMVSETK